ncbi:MAG: hypothetical protein ACJ75K_11050 [Actinomycetes bacterium]
MSAVDNLSELVQQAAVAERAALASKWKERPDVEALRRRVQRAIDEQRDVERRSTGRPHLSPRRAGQLEAFLTGDGGPVKPHACDDHVASGADASPLDDGRVPPTDVAEDSGLEPVSYADAARIEADAMAAVTVARLALQEAHLAVLDARLARLDAGEVAPEAASVDGYVPLTGRNAVSRHGPALAHGLRGEIAYILTRKPRTVVRSLAISSAMGLLYLGFLRAFEWDTKQRLLPYLGLWAISVVMGGAVCLNAMSFDAMRVRAALDSGARLWHLLVIKNLALASLVAPLGFLLSALLAWRAGDLGAFFKACALMTCFILLWLGVGNILSIFMPIRDEPIRDRRRSGTLKQFIIAFTVSYLVGYMVNLMLIWRVFAARELASRLGDVVIPVILVMLSSVVMWLLLTVFAVALAQQPKVHRALLREIADYKSNAEARAFAEDASHGGPSRPHPVGAAVREQRE